MEFAIDRMQWDGVKAALVAYGGFTPTASSDGPSSGQTPSTTTPTISSAPALTAEFLLQIGKLIEYAQPALGNDDQHFSEQTTNLLKSMRSPGADVTTVKMMLVNYSHRLSFVAEDQAEIKNVLLKLLHLVL